MNNFTIKYDLKNYKKKNQESLLEFRLRMYLRKDIRKRIYSCYDINKTFYIILNKS